MYCRNCGKKLSDGEVCNCQPNKLQSTAEELEQATANAEAFAAQHEKSNGYDFFEDCVVPQQPEPQPEYADEMASIQPDPNYGPERMGKCIATAIIYPLLVIALSIFLFAIHETSVWGMIATILCCIGGAFCIIYGGFYLIIIPLPIIFLFKYGCVKPYLPLGQRVILGLLSFVLILGSIGLMFVL